ncbi:response regulator [Chitinophaga niabensis]|uniref:Response regulator receiver domain-containing protein n=1 Tax=Chitinophaga niabensis TaxID=536979 RepID=A0A1N6G140_9BACT|nr:response regulator [Chitinophaga niabensis]SIO01275.1 Response regulator receiver domain-containing protein [Chitinophaga niabensis]
MEHIQFLGHTKKTIFLAEDDLDDQEMLEYAVREVDPYVDIVSITNGRKFIAHLESVSDQELPVLIVLDYNLPELSGVEIVKLLNQERRYQAIPKVMWSTSSSPVHKSISIELGILDYIIKPSDMASFISIAKHMLSFIKEPLA